MTGRKWAQVAAALEADKERGGTLNARFKRQTQLASYFVSELAVLANMCFGRSINCIDWLERDFPYETLVSLCNNPYLPATVRGGFVRRWVSIPGPLAYISSRIPEPCR